MDYKHIKSGFYYACEDNGKEPVFNCIAHVKGEYPFLRIDLWQPSFSKDGIWRSDHDVKKYPLIFGDRLNIDIKER